MCRCIAYPHTLLRALPHFLTLSSLLLCSCSVLKIDHPRVIDTSLVFQYSGIPEATPPLALVALVREAAACITIFRG